MSVFHHDNLSVNVAHTAIIESCNDAETGEEAVRGDANIALLATENIGLLFSFDLNGSDTCDSEPTDSEPTIAQIDHPKPANRELVSAALRLLARRDMSRNEFVSKLAKANTPNLARSSRSFSTSASPRPRLNSRTNSNSTPPVNDVFTPGEPPQQSFCSSRFNKTKSANRVEFSADEIEAAAAWCAAEGFLNEARFAEGKARTLAGRYGAKRVAATLKQKGVTDEIVAETVAALKETDLARARAMWLRKFAEPAKNANDRNKQVRYLQSRGFGFDVIKRVISGATNEDEG